MFEESTLAYATMPPLPQPKNRVTVSPDNFTLPPGTTVVSVDNHLSVSEDIWYKGFPERLRDRAPRVWFDQGTYHIGFDGKTMFPEAMVRGFAAHDPMPGTSQVGPRMLDMDADGIDKEIVYPNGMLAMLSYKDLEIREWIYKVYNDYLVELASQAPDRFYGVPLLPNFWDGKRVAESVAEIKAQGFKTVMLPQKPGFTADGQPINYQDDNMAPMWEAIEDAGIPVSFHIGEGFVSGRGGFGTGALVQLSPFRQIFGQLAFGGVFDRHPKLKVAFVEAGINWVASTLQDADMVCNAQRDFVDYKINHTARWYWENHCYASFMIDPLGLRLLDLIGIDRVMWSADYPHMEGSNGFSRHSMKAVIDAVKDDNDARKILGGTALELYGL